MRRNRLIIQFAVVCVFSLLITGVIYVAVAYSTAESSLTWWFQKVISPVHLLGVEAWVRGSILIPGNGPSSGSHDIHNVPNGIGVYCALFVIIVLASALILGAMNCLCFARRRR